MPGGAGWLLLGVAFWSGCAGVLAFAVAHALRWSARLDGAAPQAGARREPGTAPGIGPARPREQTPPTRILVVDDDAPFRALIAATLSGETYRLAEAGSVEEARRAAEALVPDVVLLDVALPGPHGLVLCAELQELERPPSVVLLTGTAVSEKFAHAAGADAVLRKPFSPLELLETIERLIRGAAPGRQPLPAPAPVEPDSEQLIVYARDLAQVAAAERAQRQLLEDAYRQTVTAFASALEARDTSTTVHSLRMTRVALELTEDVWPELLDDPSLVYGFLLHDIGKIALPDSILLKEGPLEASERRLMQRHPEIGESLLGEVAPIQGEGLRIVRSHHERWDGGGYPDALAAGAIPRGARVCAVADTLDALTNARPYRPARDWGSALEEIASEAGRQFDPRIVEALLRCEPTVRTIHEELGRAA